MRLEHAFGAQSTYWYSTGYDLLNRPTNAMDSVSLAREECACREAIRSPERSEPAGPQGAALYNRRSELAAAAIGTNLYGYAYDTIGNRLWSAENVATNTYTANSLNQYTTILRASAPPREPIYDTDGNLTNDGVFTYTYDAENRLIAAYPVSPVAGSLAVVSRYDHRHRRVQKIVKRYDGMTWETAETHTFVWDGNNIVLEKVEFANGTTRTLEYFWGMDKSGTEQGAGGVEGLLAVSVDGVFYIPCYDHNGNIVLYVSETGSVAAQYTYDPYGNVTEQSGNLADVFYFGFSTKYHDREIGIVSYQRRFYRPDLGRWLTRDPIGEFGNENLYAFCENDCVSQVDYMGLLRVVFHRFGGVPPDGWGHRDNQGVTIIKFKIPVKIARVRCQGSKISYRVSFNPNESCADIYLRETLSIRTIDDELEHIKCGEIYDNALDSFKSTIEAICECPATAETLYNEAAIRLKKAEQECKRCNERLDASGGPHGH